LKHGRKDGGSLGKVKGSPYLMKTARLQFFAMVEDISLKKKYDESLQIEKG
jgi:hypothetical protein